MINFDAMANSKLTLVTALEGKIMIYEYINVWLHLLLGKLCS